MMHGLIASAKVLYGSLPAPFRGAGASAYGWYLRWWRYGPETDSLVSAALERETWDDERWQEFRDARLAEILYRAATRVPYYRDQWRSRRAAGDDASRGELANWPILGKETVRIAPHAFLADDVNHNRLFRLSTSGTSGTPITTWRSRRTMRDWYALFEARTRIWYDVDRSMPWAILGGQIVAPAGQTEPPFWVWNSGLRQLYLSSLHINELNAAAYLGAMRFHRVRYLLGYASSMYWLASYAHDQGLEAPPLSVVISNAEALLPHQRELIGRVFGCPVRDTYGMSEIVAAATECAHGAMHVWPEVGVIEVVDDHGNPALPGVAGRLVCTGLLNRDMPLIRYETEDRGMLDPVHVEPCSCGRRLPTLGRIEGRASDVLLAADGRRVFWYNAQFYDLPIREGQVVQEVLGAVHVNVVPGTGYTAKTEEVIQQRVRQRLGEVRVEVYTLTSIPRGPNGKFRAVVNRVVAGDVG